MLATFPAGLDHIMFTCTGSEANDLAYRAARAYTGGLGFIVTKLAYHGVTSVLSEMSPSLGAGITIPPNVRLVDAPDAYHLGNADVGAVFAANVQVAIDDMLAHNIKPAARLVPDIVTMGKPMGNGHPLAAMVARAEILQRFGDTTRYFNTFGGNPVSSAVGMAVLDVLEDENLIANARDTGAYLQQGLRELSQRHEILGDIRGAGLFVGVELVTDRTTKAPATVATTRLVNGLRDRFILISASGPNANVLKIRPPLVFSRANADLFLETMDTVLTEIGA